MRIYFFFILIFCHSLFGKLSAENSPIHLKNREIFSEVIQSRLPPGKDPNTLFQEVDQIGKEALDKGVDLSCYKSDFDKRPLNYYSIPIWEGEEQGKELVFLLFVWPGERELIKRDNCQGYYKTNIHSHPLSCGYTVLANTISERRFLPVEGCERKIRFCGKEVVQCGEKALDLNQETYIHQLLYEGEGVTPAITLHLYQCGSALKLAHIFSDESAECVYPESCILKDCSTSSIK